MAIYQVEGPDGHVYKFEGPDDATQEQKLGYASHLHQQRLAEIKQHEERTGFIPSVKAGYHEFMGNTEEALGFDKAAEEHRQKAALSEATTEEDVARAKEKGVLPYVGAELRKNITEPLGGILGRYGAPMAAAPIAAAAAPELAIGAIGAGALATGLTDLPAEIGGNIERQKQTGTGEVNYVNAVGAGLAQAAITAIGIPGTGAINKLVGPKLLAEAEAIAPRVISGEITKEAAVKTLSSRVAEYARAVASNAVGGTGMMIGTEELSRAQAGQDLMTPEEMGQSAVQAGILAPIFGALHGSQRQKAGAILTDAERRNRAIETINREREQRDADIERYRAEAKTQAEKEAAEEAVRKRQAYHDTLESNLSHLFPEVHETTTDERKADVKAALKEPSGIMYSDPVTGHERELTMGEHFEQKYPDLFPKAEPKAGVLDEKTLTSLGLDMNKPGSKALLGLDLNEYAQREQFNKILDKQNLTLPQKNAIDAFKLRLPEIPKADAVAAKRMVLESDKVFTNPSQIRKFLEAKVGKDNVAELLEQDKTVLKGILSEYKQSKPKQGTDRASVRGTDLGGNKDTSRVKESDIGGVDVPGDVTGQPAKRTRTKSTTLKTEPSEAEVEALKKVLAEKEAADKAAEAKRLADEQAATEAKRLADEQAAAEAAKKAAEAKRLADEQAAAEAAKVKTLSPEAEALLAKQKADAERLAKIKEATKKVQPVERKPLALTEDERAERAAYLEDLAAQRKSRIKKVSKEDKALEEESAKIDTEEHDVNTPYDLKSPSTTELNEYGMLKVPSKFANNVYRLKSFGEVLNHIKRVYNDVLNKDELKLLDKLNSFKSVRDTNFRLNNIYELLRNEFHGLYIPDKNEIVLREHSPEYLRVMLHEGVHAATHHELKNHVRFDEKTQTYKAKTEAGQKLIDVFEKAKRLAAEKQFDTAHNAFKNLDEFISEVHTDRQLRAFLKDKSLWNTILDAIRSMLGLQHISKHTLDEAISASDVMFKDRSIKATKEGRVLQSPKKEPNAAMKELYERAGGIGFKARPQEPNVFKSAWDNPSDAMKKSGGWLHNYLKEKNTMWFSSDAAFMVDLEKALRQNGLSFEEIRKLQLQLSTGQALHREALAHQVLDKGGLRYDPNTYKYVAFEKDGSWKSIIDAIKTAANQNNLSFEETEKYAHQAIVASRLRGLLEQKAVARQRLDAELAVAKNAEAERRAYEKFDVVNDKIIHLSEDQIAAGEQLFQKIPGLEKVVEQWNKVRKNIMDFAVESGLYTESDRDTMLNIMEWAPFYRVEQLEQSAGPKEYSRGLLDLAKDKKFHGSTKEVNNVFDNMERWVSYIIRKGVGNRSAADLTKAAMEHFNSEATPDEVIKLEEGQKIPHGMKGNVVGIWEHGSIQKYLYKDPMYVHAFTGMEPIVIPALKGARKFTDMLRQSIVLNPLFSLGQLSQDSFGAMFTSGVKHPFAIPVEVMKEFVKTLRGTSTTHELLKDYGVVGHRDYSSIVSRIDAEVSAGLRQPKLLDRIGKPFRFFSMASDNAVRQAIFNQTMKETGDKALAIERAFEVINFRRSGASSNVNLLRQTVPFFGAYLQAMNVTAKVIAGHGIAPEERARARATLATTFAKVLVAGLIYNAMVSDDDGYKKLDPSVRDRRLIIPGTDGISLPLRNDFFTFFSKIVPEHMYQMTLAEGTEDATKAKKALLDGFVNAMGSPNITPQIIKPTLEVAVNHNFFTGRPIVGQYEQKLETAQQYSVNTSELAKAIGSTGLISPLNVDHLMKAYFGYSGGMALLATDHLMSAASDTSLPDKSFQDTIASIPGASLFVSKDTGTKEKNDFYELRSQVDTVVNTFNFMKKHATAEERKAYMAENKQLLQVKTQVNNINRALALIRNQERSIYDTPDVKMSPEVKQEKIKALRDREKVLLRNVEKLRLRAGL